MTTKNFKERPEDAAELPNHANMLDTFDFDFSDEECEQGSWDHEVSSSKPLSTTDDNNILLKPANLSLSALTSTIEGNPHGLGNDDGNDQIWDVEVEAKLTSQEAVSNVKPNDVLFGRSSQARRHIGNKYFRDLVRSHEEQYNSATKREDKGLIIKAIVSTIHGRGGRFLKRSIINVSNIDAWTVVDSVDAHDKVSHTLRNLRLWGNHQSHNSPPHSPKPKAKPATKFSLEKAAKSQLRFESLLHQRKSLLGTARGSGFPSQAKGKQVAQPKSTPSHSNES